jgi:hypothetical protein
MIFLVAPEDLGDSDEENTAGLTDTVVSGSEQSNLCKLSRTTLTLLKRWGLSLQPWLFRPWLRSVCQ